MKNLIPSKDLLKLYMGGFLDEEEAELIDELVEDDKEWKDLYEEVKKEILNIGLEGKEVAVYMAEVKDKWKKKVESDGPEEAEPAPIFSIRNLAIGFGIAAVLLTLFLLNRPTNDSQQFYSSSLLAVADLSKNAQLERGAYDSLTLELQVGQWMNQENYASAIDKLEGLALNKEPENLYMLWDLALAYIEKYEEKDNGKKAADLLRWIEGVGYEGAKNQEDRLSLQLYARAKLAQLAGLQKQKEEERKWLELILAEKEKPEAFRPGPFYEFIEAWYKSIS